MNSSFGQIKPCQDDQHKTTLMLSFSPLSLYTQLKFEQGTGNMEEANSMNSVLSP